LKEQTEVSLLQIAEMVGNGFRHELGYGFVFTTIYELVDELALPGPEPDMKAWLRHSSRLGILVLGPGDLADMGLPAIGDDEEPEVAFFKVVEMVADGLGNEGGDGVKLPAFHIRLDFPPVKLFDSISKRHDIPLYYTSCDISTF